jgi:hypothetical protein
MREIDRVRRKKNKIECYVFIVVVDCSSFASSREDDDDGVRIIFERSAVVGVELGGSFDLKILYPTPAGFGKSTGRGRNATLVKYGEKFVF